MSVDLTSHLVGVPADLAQALNSTYRDVMGHFLKGEWDDAQVDAGRFCEAALRYLEFRMTGSFTLIDGKSKPNRKTTVNKARQDTALPPSLRSQIPQSVELTMDFRNNRNSAHLGNIDANKLDATTVVQNVTWIIGEILRLETQKPPVEVQRVLDQLAERHVPLVQTVNGRPIILQPKMEAADKAMIILYQQAKPVPIQTLRNWVGYANATRWRDTVLRGLQRKARIHVENGEVTLLYPGEVAAQELILKAGGL